jgi:hypothetical protein
LTVTPETEVGEGDFKARAGALTLIYLASPMKRSVLLALLAEATTGVDLMDEIELPDPDDPVDLEVIADPYLVEPTDPDLGPDDPIGWDTTLRASPAGVELLFVGFALERWLNSCPSGALMLGPEAGPALSALLGGWCSTVMHALAAQPRTVAEATEAVGTLGYDHVEDCIDEMENAGQVELLPDDGSGEERFAVTDWLRMAIAPLGAAARMEHRHPPGDTAPIAALDVEAAFQLTLPLLELPEELSGSCSLAVDLEEGVSPSPAGVTARVENGRVVACEAGPNDEADTVASAPAADWLETVIEPDAQRVPAVGERRLADGLVDELHQTLFGVPVG